VLYPILDRCGIKRTPRADGFHAFRRAVSKYLGTAGGLELAAVQLGHKRLTDFKAVIFASHKLHSRLLAHHRRFKRGTASTATPLRGSRTSHNGFLKTL
jgi:hypothetical protein